MKQAGLAAGLVCCLLFGGLADSAIVSAEREVLQVLDHLAQAGMRRDVETLDRLYAQDYFPTNPDGSVMERAAVLASYRAPTPFTFHESRRSDERVHVSGECTVENAIVTLSGTRNTDAFTSRYRITYVLRREHRRWLIVDARTCWFNCWSCGA